MRPAIRHEAQRAHISTVRLRQRRDNPDWKPKPNSYGLRLKKLSKFVAASLC
jgi:hypothetical protein